MGAGHETTATTAAAALHCVAAHPEVEARLLAELDDVLGEPSFLSFLACPACPSVSRLPRLAPPHPPNTRPCTHPCAPAGGRPPTYADLERLPYLAAVVREVRPPLSPPPPRLQWGAYRPAAERATNMLATLAPPLPS